MSVMTKDMEEKSKLSLIKEIADLELELRCAVMNK